MTIDEVVTLVLNGKSKRTGEFNKNSGPNKDKKIGYNYTDEEVVSISQNGIGHMGYSFSSIDNYENDKLTYHKDLPNEDFIRDILSSYSATTSVDVFLNNGNESKKIGKLFPHYKE